jgi:hypothetical protein
MRFVQILEKNGAEILTVFSQAFGEEKHEPYTESLRSLKPKKVKQVKSKANRMHITFFDIKRIVHEELVRAGKQSCLLL